MFAKFSMRVDSVHYADRGETENIHKLSGEALRKRTVVYIDVAKQQDDGKKMYDGDNTDASTFVSKLTGRGPLQQGWQKECEPVMCAYKLVYADFDYWGLQGRVEEFMQVYEQGLFQNANRQLWCWIDDWHKLSIEDVRAYENEVAERTNLITQIKEGKVTGQKISELGPIKPKASEKRAEAGGVRGGRVGEGAGQGGEGGRGGVRGAAAMEEAMEEVELQRQNEKDEEEGEEETEEDTTVEEEWGTTGGADEGVGATANAAEARGDVDAWEDRSSIGVLDAVRQARTESIVHTLDPDTLACGWQQPLPGQAFDASAPGGHPGAGLGEYAEFDRASPYGYARLGAGDFSGLGGGRVEGQPVGKVAVGLESVERRVYGSFAGPSSPGHYGAGYKPPMSQGHQGLVGYGPSSLPFAAGLNDCAEAGPSSEPVPYGHRSALQRMKGGAGAGAGARKGGREEEEGPEWARSLGLGGVVGPVVGAFGGGGKGRAKKGRDEQREAREGETSCAVHSCTKVSGVDFSLIFVWRRACTHGTPR